MDLNLSVFQEPRGVMRVIHFIFAICAFATTVDYTGMIDFICDSTKFEFSYPFDLDMRMNFSLPQGPCNMSATIIVDFSHDAKFFVATGVLAMLYSIAAIALYTKFDQLYKTNNQVPLGDFVLSVVLAVLWLSSSAAWANGLAGLKHVTSQENIKWDGTSDSCKCPTSVSSFFTLNVSVIFGFLNFFLWAANLWFLYKETTWFASPQPTTEGV